MYAIGLITLFVHIVAFVAGGANLVLMPVVGPKLATATPEQRGLLMEIVERFAKTGKYAFGLLLLTGILTLWLKWDWAVPNHWFWVKMLGVAAMIVFIGLNDMNRKRAKAGDAAAAKRSQLFGQLTGIAFLAIILSAVLTFG
ncbi:hypothetical protein PRN20_19745 [Devosia sp. ZB163]|uniref:hypothetical protein n=1 Tax=Devosia sp. ZB163 TaxID=3025938 RepID=UPI002360F41A|nr:hypothetical protein [Devosia sp. ZB163]MDC9825975.1 hypothetical protein [Devosia sp. ZB163]